MTEKNTAYNAPLLYRAFAILDEIARHQSELGISDLARRLNISKSTVYGITGALTQLGVLRQDEETKKFRLGPTLLRLGSQVLNGKDLRAIAKPFLEELCRRFQVTVFMGMLSGDHGVTIIESAESTQQIKISVPVGTRLSIFTGATGKVFLAFSPPELVEKILASKPLPKHTHKSITDPVAYRQTLAETRHQGYAIDEEEYLTGVNAICVPLLESSGNILAAIWMVGFSHSFQGEQLTQAVAQAQEAVAKIAEQLEL